ncbi:2-methylcitrate dehydratase [Polynucleobacter tropicus]|uniref:2-methylcitrate dehydratase n=1 Tax=Polynucleobacter tropicus TaxID=1743174 RepID=A0A6M9Q162_9BURK|nr:MmgE/PrpD family protein [Polynucleobacter tropicus]QKM64957.1 2-methylcitrate dehydratase [Polynucleobacter tropicus]
MTLLQKFGEFIAASQQADFSAQAIHSARRALLDWHGALLAGSDTLVAKKLRHGYQEELGAGGCTVAGADQKSFSRAAAFLNGTISHIAEFDDIFRDGAYHPACPTISAAFALAEAHDDSLLNLLKAIIIGYEVSTRISKVIQPSHYQYFHTTGTVGVFGAAAACAYLLRLDAGKACDALATAGTFASGLQQAFRSDSMTKPMHAGHAAEVGLNAALLANAGMTGTPDLLEGDAGFGAALCKNPRWDLVLEDLGHGWNIEHMTFKNHGCCGHNFPAIDAVSHLLSAYPIDAEKITQIRVGAYKPTVDVCHYVHPQSPFEAKFSLTYTVSARIILGRVREMAFLPTALDNPRIRAMEKKIKLFVDPECAAKFPVHRSAKVEIEMSDGSIYTHHQHTRHGDPDEPLTDQELLDKFQELAEPRVGMELAKHLSDELMESPDVKIRKLATLWSKMSA